MRHFNENILLYNFTYLIIFKWKKCKSATLNICLLCMTSSHTLMSSSLVMLKLDFKYTGKAFSLQTSLFLMPTDFEVDL